MDAGDVRTLVDFHYWARDRMLDTVEQLSAEQFMRQTGGSFTSVRDTVVHIYSAEWLWLGRWRGDPPAPMLTPEAFPDLASIRAAWAENEAKLRRFVDDLGPAGVTRVIEYKMLSGRSVESIFWQMLQHVVNHATYHRGQVTTLLRQLGATPKGTDLIAFYRERQAPV